MKHAAWPECGTIFPLNSINDEAAGFGLLSLSAKPLTVRAKSLRLRRHSMVEGRSLKKLGPGQELPRPAGPACR